MGRIYLLAAAAVAAVTVVGVAAHATTTSHHVSACADSANRLTLKVHGHCLHGQHTVSLPDAAVRGATGARGPKGAPGPYPSVVPSGKTLTGVWAIGGTATAANQYTYDATNFAFPFAVAPVPELVITGHVNPDPVHCAGTAATPTAARGYLCVYADTDLDVTYLEPYSPVSDDVGGATRFGWGVVAGSTSAGNVVLQGTWAATAK